MKASAPAAAPLGAETRSACYDLENRPKMVNIVYGLGGRDCSVEDTERVFAHLEHIVETGELGSRYLHMGQRDLREEVL